VKTLIGVPTFGTVSTIWSQRFNYIQKPLGSISGELFDPRPVDIATKRNSLIQYCIDKNIETILFIGDDVHPPAEVLSQMMMRHRQGYKAITGVYWTKNPNPEPYIYRGLFQNAFYDWKAGDFIKIDWAGCDCLLLDIEMLKKIPKPWFSLEYDMQKNNENPEMLGFLTRTEDLYFFSKLKDAGVELWCDTAIQCLHEDRTTHRLYGLIDGMPQKTRDPVAEKGLLIADIGCGHTVNPLYQDNTIRRYDLDETCKPTHVCDVRSIPEEDEVFDLAQASHVLEHLKIHDTVNAIKEWLRIVKVGGRLEIRVPDLRYAAQKVLDGTLGGSHVVGSEDIPYHFLMLYGAQNDQGQIHYNGFNKERLEDVLKQAGCTEYTIESTQPDDAGVQTELKAIITKSKSSKPDVLKNWTNGSQEKET
jgi:predicted SAM-dependent methyltransferase